MITKIVSFNIRCCDDNGGNTIKERAPRLFEVIKPINPDLIGFQEYRPQWEEYIKYYFDNEYDMFCKYRSETSDDIEASPILWKRDKFDVINKGYFWLSDTPDTESKGWDEIYDCFRMCVYVILKDRKTGTVFNFMNTHFGFGDNGQVASANLIYEKSKSISEFPTFIVGDFNMMPKSVGYKTMTNGFTDANEKTIKDRRGTYHGYINKTDIFEDIKINDNNDIVKIGEEIDKAYIEAVKAQSLGQEIPQDYKVVYTPIHGSGNVLVRQILSEIGVGNVFVVPEQEMPDGDFTTVISPNPEHPQTLSLAVEYAKKNNADIVLGTDPDSDRIGVAICDKSGNYILLNGNQTGVIICEYILRKLKERSDLPEKGTVIKTIVTTEMIKSITEDYGVQMDDVLTGFKFIGDKIKQFEDKGEKERFLFGLEESYGYLKGTYARDKDAVVAAMLITEVAAECKENGVTLYERLMHLYDRYGCHLEKLETKTFNGIDGRKQIDIIMEKFRTQKIPFKVCEMKDYLNGIDGLPKSDVLKFYVENGWFAVRPSGTEPKIKFYFGIKEPTVELANEKLEEFVDRIMNFAEVD